MKSFMMLIKGDQKGLDHDSYFFIVMYPSLQSSSVKIPHASRFAILSVDPLVFQLYRNWSSACVLVMVLMIGWSGVYTIEDL